MSEEKTLAIVEQRTIIFYDDEIIAVVVEEDARRRVYVPLRPICDALEVAWASQLNRVKRDPVLSKKVKGVFITNTPGGRQEMSCLPLDYLNGWLFGISASRVKDEIRDRLIRYQEECYRALSEAFQEGRLTTDPTFAELLQSDSDAVQAYKIALAVVKLARNQVLLEARLDDHEKDLARYGERLEQIEAKLGSPERTITEDQASQISQAVKAVAIALGKQTKRNEFGAIYGELYRKYGLTSYKLLPAKQFEDAMNFLTEWHQDLVGNVPF